MTTKEASDHTTLQFASDALHIIKDLARLEKKHKDKILRAHSKLAQALCEMDNEFKFLNARIDSIMGKS